MMQHGRYFAEIEFDPEMQSFYGRTVNVNPGGFDFWGTSVEELQREFATSARAFEEFAAEEGIAFEVGEPPSGASRAAKRLGKASTPAKAAAARANGQRGGRPRRTDRREHA